MTKPAGVRPDHLATALRGEADPTPQWSRESLSRMRDQEMVNGE